MAGKRPAGTRLRTVAPSRRSPLSPTPSRSCCPPATAHPWGRSRGGDRRPRRRLRAAAGSEARPPDSPSPAQFVAQFSSPPPPPPTSAPALHWALPPLSSSLFCTFTATADGRASPTAGRPTAAVYQLTVPPRIAVPRARGREGEQRVAGDTGRKQPTRPPRRGRRADSAGHGAAARPSVYARRRAVHARESNRDGERAVHRLKQKRQRPPVPHPTRAPR